MTTKKSLEKRVADLEEFLKEINKSLEKLHEETQNLDNGLTLIAQFLTEDCQECKGPSKDAKRIWV